MEFLEVIFKVLHKSFDWFMALSPTKQVKVAEDVVHITKVSVKLYRHCVTWFKHWYDTRHHGNETNEEHVGNKKEQHYLVVMLLLHIIVRTVLIYFCK